jgi:serine phosphatase RsbU (regulator of sigma subunit)
MTAALFIKLWDGPFRPYPIKSNPFTIGRSGVNDLHFDDEGLSRRHLVIERKDSRWLLTDAKSRNGTYLNGKPLAVTEVLRDRDRINAGHLVIEFREGYTVDPSPTPIEFEDSSTDVSISTATNLAAATDRTLTSSADIARARRLMDALLRAGRELAARRPLNELFQAIVDLLIDVVRAPRGVLLIVEDGDPVVRALTGHPRGEPFRTNRYILDRVIQNRESLMERAELPSFIAVPLQTDRRVLGVIYLDSPDVFHEFTNDDLDLATVMANIAALHMENARVAEVEEIERQVRRDLEQAAEIQRILLPATSPKVDGLDLAGYSIPCHTIGGDYYDFLSCPDGHVAIIVADVAGHGLPAALLMSNLQARVGMVFDGPENLAGAVARLNQMICRNCPVNRFISFFVAVVCPQRGDIRYCNAGHNPPLLLRADGALQRLETGGGLLGIDPEGAYAHADLNMSSGDVLVLFSDGVTEAWRPDGTDDFGEHRVAVIAADMRHAPAITILNAIGDQLMAWIGKADPADDITLVVAKKT